MKNTLFKKFSAKILLLAIILNLFRFTAYASGFSDVTSGTPNSQAILYLQDHGILQGYSDGSFKPTRAVNRAELLKIIIEGSGISLDASEPTPFSDIDYGTWYAPYIKKAYAAGWINGYSDNTFRPGQTINKVEALKIIGKAQNWQLQTAQSLNVQNVFSDVEKNSWYESYVAYAEQNNYLEDKGPTLSPTSLMTRGSISEIIYRTIANGQNSSANSTVNSSQSSTVNNVDSINTTSSSDFKFIAKDSFDNINLSADLPNLFYKNEVYTVEGDISSGSYKDVTFIYESEDRSIHKDFMGQVTNNHFKIPVFFKNSGNFIVGIAVGNKESKGFDIHVNTYLPESSNTDSTPSTPQKITITYSNDKTSLSFIKTPDTIKKFTFSQGQNTVTYFSRQNVDNIPVEYKDFAGFTSGTVNYSTSLAKIQSQAPLEITSAFSKDLSKSFNAVEHSFINDDQSEIQMNLPDTLSSIKNFNVSGTAKTDILNEVLVIKPNGGVDEMKLNTTGQTYTYFDQQAIKQGSAISFSYTPTDTGRYIFELNNKNSQPAINHPIYVGNITPLIPDYFDLNETNSYTGTFNLNNERQKLLDLINKDRTDYGLNQVTMDSKLNILAQEHSDDMKTNNYFSHYDSQNRTPDERRVAMGIPTPVGENIAIGYSVEFVHFGLMRSASHHQNILTKDWKKVGLGIAYDDINKELIVTEEFADNPITSDDLIQFKADLITNINNLRQNKNIASLTENVALNKSSEQLNNDNINSTQPSSQSFGTTLDNNNFTGNAQLVGRIGSPWSFLEKSLLDEESTLVDQAWKYIGVNIQTDKIGKIYTIVIVGDDK